MVYLTWIKHKQDWSTDHTEKSRVDEGFCPTSKQINVCSFTERGICRNKAFLCSLQGFKHWHFNPFLTLFVDEGGPTREYLRPVNEAHPWVKHLWGLEEKKTSVVLIHKVSVFWHPFFFSIGRIPLFIREGRLCS